MRTINIGGWEFIYDKSSGTIPVFTWELRRRVKQELATNVVVVGEAGIGKSYMAIQLAQNLDPKMTVDQVVFTYKEYLDVLMQKKSKGKPIVFDEPSYAMSHRDWYKEVNKALTKTIESQRFLVRPLFIPIINTNLLDKTVRSYLIQFKVCMIARGRAVVYRLDPSQHEDKVYRHNICNLHYGLVDSELCSKPSCLDCRKLWMGCNLFRARYERKKAEIQMSRYRRELELASTLQAKELSLDDIAETAHHLREYYLNEDGSINTIKLKLMLKLRAGINIGLNKAYEVKAMLEHKYPELKA